MPINVHCPSCERPLQIGEFLGVAIVPLTPCWILALPIGIWALIMLQKPHVKSAFR